MAITQRNPQTIHLGGHVVLVNDIAASEAITPGMLVEKFTSGGVTRYRKSTLTGLQNKSFMKESMLQNLGIDDVCAAADLIEVVIGSPGTTIYAIIASGANISAGATMSDAGNGKVKAGSGVTVANALETVNNSAGPGDARIRIEVV